MTVLAEKSHACFLLRQKTRMSLALRRFDLTPNTGDCSLHWQICFAEAGLQQPPTSEHEQQAAEGEIQVSVQYTFSADGTMLMEWMLDASHALPAKLATGLMPSLPRVGIRWAVPGSQERVTWYGRGPHECYSDRKVSALLGRYRSPVQEMPTQYIFPQENGGRADVRWFALHAGSLSSRGGDGAGSMEGMVVVATAASAWDGGLDAQGSLEAIHTQPRTAAVQVAHQQAEGSSRSATAGVACQGAPAVHIAISPYSMECVHQAGHTYELQADTDGSMHVHVDAAHVGVGGDDSWSPSVHEAYLIRPAKYTLGLLLAPLSVMQGEGWAGPACISNP